MVRQIRTGDDLEMVHELFEESPEIDLLLISGGASVGDRDIAKPLLRELGFDIVFEKINLRPGKPLVFIHLFLCEKLNRSNKSSIAGLLVGTYGLAAVATGFGSLSRLRVEIVGKFQLCSMNFRIET